MTKKGWIRLAALILALIMPILTATTVLADGNTDDSTRYASPDINALMGAGLEPEEISVSAGATYLEKAWYEYVVYSEHAVASYRLDDDHRILFYDPYTYTNSMIMDVQFDAATTEFDTMSSYSISHTSSKTVDACTTSTETTTNARQESGRDQTGSEVWNDGSTTTNYNHQIDNPTYGQKTETTNYGYKEYRYETSSTSYGGGAGTKNLMGTLLNVATGAITGGVVGGLVGLASGLEVKADIEHSTTDNAAIVKDSETTTTVYSEDYKTSTEYTGSDTVEYDTHSRTEGWTELSARVTKTLGSSIATSNGWSETDEITITKVYAATHFASDGVTPLPWAIVHYQVQMPMKCCLQVKYSGEWVTISTAYCLLTTVQGSCRAWMQNGQVYYEDWGNGEPVVATDFWSQFMTKEQLVAAYQNKLYPVGGVD
jgi:hypothetical protein